MFRECSSSLPAGRFDLSDSDKDEGNEGACDASYTVLDVSGVVSTVLVTLEEVVENAETTERDLGAAVEHQPEIAPSSPVDESISARVGLRLRKMKDVIVCIGSSAALYMSTELLRGISWT